MTTKERCSADHCKAFARIGKWCISHHVIYGPIKEAEARLDQIEKLIPKAEASIENWQRRRAGLRRDSHARPLSARLEVGGDDRRVPGPHPTHIRPRVQALTMKKISTPKERR
jgi:hypothetical protein